MKILILIILSIVTAGIFVQPVIATGDHKDHYKNHENYTRKEIHNNKCKEKNHFVYISPTEEVQNTPVPTATETPVPTLSESPTATPTPIVAPSESPSVTPSEAPKEIIVPNAPPSTGRG